MHRIAVALAAPLAALGLAASPVLAASPAQLDAQRQLERGESQDRVADVAREMERGVPAPALVDDMNRQRPTVAPDGMVSRPATPREPNATNLPLLGDNVQR